MLGRWHKDIGDLYSGIRNNPDIIFDDKFYDEIVEKKEEFEKLSYQDQCVMSSFPSSTLNEELSLIEVSDAINQVKFNKAYLDIPNEAMENVNAKILLHKFFNACFMAGMSPADWSFSDIKPIPKKEKDPRDPLQCRCITIMCCVAKVYSRILNCRLQRFLEQNAILVEEQNGFRASRSCIDHIFVLCSILRNRKALNLPTFLMFIDFQKAFDKVNRNLLLYMLSQI